MSTQSAEASRECGSCSLCCRVLRVDEIGKLAGEPCPQLRPEGGCGIYPRRPRICSAYRCLWLRGGLEEADRPDHLGAVVDVLTEGASPRMSIQEARDGAFDASPRLRAIAERTRATMPVRVVPPGHVLDADRPFRVLLADGEEHRVRGECVEIWRDGRRIARRRLPWLERLARRLGNAWRRARIARARRNRVRVQGPRFD
jgi:hypothetical protein